ncbi:kynureninase [uncultured Amnibacterium sp.]|uniref:kynureninase n=1 Tax=uncultured Amnibacterium sp. TaxID=1631851 RepID=UPI0035C969DF
MTADALPDLHDLDVQFEREAVRLDETDPLAAHRDRFVPTPGLVAYLDGNSLGRPLIASADRLSRFTGEVWAPRLIRAWEEGMLDLPVTVGDEIGRVALGAAPGQTVVGDSTTVLLYKLVRAAIAARPDRTDIVLDAENFPTDRFVLEGVAAETGRTLRWLEVDPDAGPTADALTAVLSRDTALVVLSAVSYRSAFLADVTGISALVAQSGALLLWDLSHATGVVPMHLDVDGVDLAVGCTYKYVNGGPGSPAFAYVAARLQPLLRQPIQGWLGAADPFAMEERYRPAVGMRAYLSGTPPVLGMLAMQDMLQLLDAVGLDAVRTKSMLLTAYTIRYADAMLAPLGVRVASPRDPQRLGGHVMLEHPDFREVVPRLWRAGVIPDFRAPNGLRVGLSPLSTGFVELYRGLTAIRNELVAGQ